MAERLGIEDFLDKLALTCVNTHAPFAKVVLLPVQPCNIGRSKTFRVFQSSKIHIKCLMTNHATFDTQLGNGLPSHVHT